MLKDRLPTGVSISLLIVGLWTIIPIVQVDMIYRLVVFVFMVILLFSVYSNYRCTSDVPGIAMVFIVLFALIDFFNGGLTKVLTNFAVYFFLLLVIVFYHLQCCDQFRNMYWLLTISTLVFTIVNIVTIYAILSDSTLIRTMVLNVEDSKAILKMGIGGYGLVFSQTVMVWISLFMVLYGKLQGKYKLLYLVHLISAVFLIFYAQFTVALLSFVVGFGFFIIFRNNDTSPGKRAFSIFLLLLVVAVLWLNLDAILEKLYIWTSETIYQDKVASFISTRQGNALEGDTDARRKVYLQSITTFLKSPIWGTIFNQTSGGHSTLLDLFSSYGIFIGGYYVYMIFSPLRYIKRYMNMCDHRINAFYWAVLSSCLVAMSLDPVGYHYWFVWLILLPIAATYLNAIVNGNYL